MLQFEPNGGLANSLNATYYDPRIDGTLKFKMYFRTNLIFENVPGASNIVGTTFRNAYIASATYNSTAYVLQQNLTSISLKLVQLSNNESLLIVPRSWSDQDKIDLLTEGYYFIGV